LNLMATTTGFDYCILCTRDSNGKSYSVEGENTPLMLKPGKPPPSFPMTHGIVGWIFRNGSPVRSGGANGSPDAMLLGKDAGIPHFQTVFALPLDIQRKTHGVLCLAHDVPLPISATTQVFARMAAEHLSLFLENLYVKCRLRDLRQEIQAEQER